MINYEKIKSGKCLTKNQKRLWEVYKKHQENLEKLNVEIWKNCWYSDSSICKREKGFFDSNRVRLQEIHLRVSDSRVIKNIYIAYDNNLKENYKIVVGPFEDYYIYGGRYADYPCVEDKIYIVLGKKNIRGWEKGKCGLVDGILTMYDNKGIFSTFIIRINHRKKVEIDVETKKTYVVKKKFKKEMYYAHGATKDEAKESLKNKISVAIKINRKEKRNKQYSLFMSKIKWDSVINIKRYRWLTGACQFGCERFAERENLPKNARLKVSELLRILQPTDFGYDRFIKMLGI